jgi:hypothetical protein
MSRTRFKLGSAHVSDVLLRLEAAQFSITLLPLHGTMLAFVTGLFRK